MKKNLISLLIFIGEVKNDMEKFKDRKEQREVTETMNALLLPMLNLNCLNADTAIKVRRALYLLGEIEVEPQADMRGEQDGDK